MSVELNHTIIPAKDKWASAKFLAYILNLEAGPEWGHFVPVKTANGVTLDFDTREEFRPAHYAFLVLWPARADAIGLAGMSMWSTPSDASTSRMALTGVCGAAMQPRLARVLAAEGLDRRQLLGKRHAERRQSPVHSTA